MSTELKQRETASDPWTDLDRLCASIDGRLVGGWELGPFGPMFVARVSGAEPALRPARTDVTDTGAAYKVIAEVPGIPKERLDIRVRGTSVEIRGEHSSSEETKESEFVHRERTYAGYYRHLEFPEAVVAAEAKAKVENGVLELELPKEHPTPADTEVKVAVA